MADKQAQRLAAERAAMSRPKGPAPARDTYDLSRQRQREANAVGGVEGDQSVDETLAGAGQALSRTQGRADAFEGMDAEVAEMARLSQEAKPGHVIADALTAGAVPAAFLSNPVGWAAGAGLTGKALYDAYNSEDGLGVSDVAMGLVGAVPGIRALRGLKGGAKAARAGRVSQEVENYAPTEDLMRRTLIANKPNPTSPLQTGWREVGNDFMPRVGEKTPSLGGIDAASQGTPASGFAVRGQQLSLDDIVDESGRVLAKAPKQTPIQTAPRSLNEPPVMEGRQFAASPDPADLPRMQMPNTRQRITRELDDLEDVTSRADQEWQRANPAMPRAMRGGQEPLSLQVMDDVIEPQGLPSMGEVDDVIGNMANVPFSKAKGSPRLNRSADQSIEAIKAAKQHGIAGFHDLPELSAGELARMSANIKRFGGR
jgi:hypothetical protein